MVFITTTHFIFCSVLQEMFREVFTLKGTAVGRRYKGCFCHNWSFPHDANGITTPLIWELALRFFFVEHIGSPLGSHVKKQHLLFWKHREKQHCCFENAKFYPFWWFSPLKPRNKSLVKMWHFFKKNWCFPTLSQYILKN